MQKGFGVAVFVGKYPGFMKRKFGSTTWGETLVMCGISIEVDEVGMHYSPHDWKGMVRLPHTAPDSGRSKEDIIGITDYEYFGRKAADRKQ